VAQRVDHSEVPACHARRAPKAPFGTVSDRLRRGFAARAIATDQAQALHTPDALRADRESDAIHQEGLLSFDLHDAPSLSLDLRRVGDVHDDRIGTRGQLTICETSRFPSILSHLCRSCFIALRCPSETSPKTKSATALLRRLCPQRRYRQRSRADGLPLLNARARPPFVRPKPCRSRRGFGRCDDGRSPPK
jgi:hypothetical protein